MKLLRTRGVISLRSAIVSGALVAALVVSMLVAATPTTASTTPGEFAAITTGCQGLGRIPSSLSPFVYVTLYNLPLGVSPTISGTISVGSITAPLTFLAGPTSPTVPPDAYVFGSGAYPGQRGQPVSISLTWSDEMGGSGSVGPQIVGLPTCEVMSRTAAAMAANQSGTGYWVVTGDGHVAGFGRALDYGDMGYIRLNAPIVGLAPTTDGEGYWLLGADGGIFSFGTAHFYGSTGSLRLNAPVVAMAATPDSGGYWFVASDGGVFAYGDAPFFGSMGGTHLNSPIVGMAVDQATGGYWLVASDGGIFAFNAPFHGSAGSLVLNSPIVGIQASPDGSGYRLGAIDGGVFSYNLPFAGSYAGQDSHPIVGIAGQGSTGYWLLDSCAGVYSFGSATFHGSGIVC
jgi:hypothetical protein